MKKYLLFLAASACFASTQAQSSASAEKDTTTKQNGWYVEVAGQSILGVTFNYEHYFSKKPGGLSVHIGFGGGYLPDIFDDGITVFGALPAGLSYNIPVSANKQHFIEVGGGYTYLFSNGGASLGSVTAGYRYVSPSGLQIRATLMPAVFLLGNGGGGPLPWAGFSIGKRF
ncbi:MAG TPA: hypothetical protein VG738_12430 [Chitinophagaceae bacterium]|nr:hypothetical protein [Chitinophagaceae bacterium]